MADRCNAQTLRVPSWIPGISPIFSTICKPWNLDCLHNLLLWNQHNLDDEDIDHLVDVRKQWNLCRHLKRLDHPASCPVPRISAAVPVSSRGLTAGAFTGNSKARVSASLALHRHFALKIRFTWEQKRR